MNILWDFLQLRNRVRLSYLLIALTSTLLFITNTGHTTICDEKLEKLLPLSSITSNKIPKSSAKSLLQIFDSNISEGLDLHTIINNIRMNLNENFSYTNNTNQADFIKDHIQKKLNIPPNAKVTIKGTPVPAKSGGSVYIIEIDNVSKYVFKIFNSDEELSRELVSNYILNHIDSPVMRTAPIISTSLVKNNIKI